MTNAETIPILLGHFDHGNKRTKVYANIPKDHADNPQYRSQIEEYKNKALASIKAQYEALSDLKSEKSVTFHGDGKITVLRKKEQPLEHSAKKEVTDSLKRMQDSCRYLAPNSTLQDGTDWRLAERSDPPANSSDRDEGPIRWPVQTQDELVEKGLRGITGSGRRKRNTLGILKSLVSVPDSRYQVTIPSTASIPQLRQMVGVEYLHNSPFIGQRYIDGSGRKRAVPKDALTVSFYDGQNEHVTMGRCLKSDPEATPFCFTGRVDTISKADEFYKWVFGKMSAEKKAEFIANDLPAKTLHILVDCLLSYCVEKDKILTEKELFDTLKDGDPFEIKDESGNVTHRFKLDPILIPHQANHLTTDVTERIFPGDSGISGKDTLRGMAKEAFVSLYNYAHDMYSAFHNRNVINALEQGLTFFGRDQAGSETPQMNIPVDLSLEKPKRAFTTARLLANLLKDDITEEEYSASIFGLSKLLGFLYQPHCKSCIDRTAQMIALAATLENVCKPGNLQTDFFTKSVKFDLAADLHSDKTKELFSAHLMAERKHAEISRCEAGYKWTMIGNKPLPMLRRMLPERYLAAPYVALWAGPYTKNTLNKLSKTLFKPAIAFDKMENKGWIKLFWPFVMLCNLVWAIGFALLQIGTFTLQCITWIAAMTTAILTEFAKHFKTSALIIIISALMIAFGPLGSVIVGSIMLGIVGAHLLLPKVTREKSAVAFDKKVSKISTFKIGKATFGALTVNLFKRKAWQFHFFGKTILEQYSFTTDPVNRGKTKVRLVWKKRYGLKKLFRKLFNIFLS